jgi:O-antigen/teichoic acid export membrane protein
VIFLDDDSEVREDFLACVHETMADDRIAVAGGPNLTPPAARESERLVGRILASFAGTGPVRHRYRVGQAGRGHERNLTLTNLAVRRSAVEGAMFDGRLEGGEENDLLARMRQSGARIVYRPELAVFHHRRDRLRAYVRQVTRYGFGRGQLMVRAFAPRQLPYFLPAFTFASMVVVGAFAPLVFALGALAYLSLLLLGALHVGTLRQCPQALAFIACTHLGYTLGLIGGATSELARALADRGSEGRRSPTARDAAGTFAALGLAVASASAAGVVIARALGPDGRGHFELARTLALSAALVAGLGLGRAAIFYHGRHRIDRGSLFGAVAAALPNGALIGAALAAVLLASDWHGLGRAEIVLAAVSLPLIAFYFQGHYALRGIGKEAWHRQALAIRDGLFLILLPPALALDLSVTLAVAAWTLHWLLGAIGIAWLLVRACGRPRHPAAAWRLLAVFGASQAAVGLLLLVHLRLDLLLLRWFKDAGEVGQYAVAFGVAEPLSFGGLAIGLVLFPRTVASAAADPRAGKERTERALRGAIMLALAGALLLTLAAPTMIELIFGEAFAPAVTPLRLLLPGVVALAALLVLQSDLAGRGRIWEIVAVQSSAVVANAALGLALIPQFGATGAAAASSTTYTLAAAALLVLFHRATREASVSSAPAGILDDAGLGVT